MADGNPSGYDTALQDAQRQLLQKQQGVVPPPPGIGVSPPGGSVKIMPYKPGAAPAAPPPGPQGPTPPPAAVPHGPHRPIETEIGARWVRGGESAAAEGAERAKGLWNTEASTIGATGAELGGEALSRLPGGRLPGAVLWVASKINKIPHSARNMILSALGGGGAESAVGGSFTEGATKEGLSTGGAELGTKGVIKTGQTLFRNYAGNKMAKQVGQIAENVGGASMAGARTPGGLGTLVSQKTNVKETMGRIQQQTTEQAASLLPQGTTFTDPTRLVLTAPGADMGKVKTFLSANPNLRMTPDELLATPWGAKMFAGGAPPAPKRYTLEEMNDRLQDLGRTGWPSRFEVSPLEASGSSALAEKARKDFAILRNHLKRDMETYGTPGVEAYKTWDGGRQVRNGGLALLEVLEHGGWMKPGRNVTRLDTAAFQKAVRDNLDNLEHRLPPDDFKRLKAVVFRNADPMTGDVPRRGGLPTSYTGVEPFSPGELGQILVNTIVSGTIDMSGAGGLVRTTPGIVGTLIPGLGGGGYTPPWGPTSGATPAQAATPTSGPPPGRVQTPAAAAAIRANADAAEANAKEKAATFRRAREGR